MFSLQLAEPETQPLPPALPGQYVTVRVPAQSEGASALLRSYSLSGPPGVGDVPDQRQAGAVRSRRSLPAK